MNNRASSHDYTRAIVKNNLFYILAVIAFTLFIISHLPFLSADADLKSSPTSRGAWTDEGIFSCQVRNYINHHIFIIPECAEFLKTPLFNLYLFAGFSMMGIHLEVARLLVLLFLSVALFYFFKNKNYRQAAFLCIPTTLLFFPIHQYSHLGLAEICSSSCLLLSAFLYSSYRQTGKNLYIAFSFLLVFAAILFKVQFLYAIAIPFLALLMDSILSKNPLLFRQLLVFSLCTFLLFILLYFGWYNLFKNDFLMVAKQHGGFTSENFAYLNFKTNFTSYLYSGTNIYFFVAYCLSVFTGIFMVCSHRVTLPVKHLLLFLIAWSLIEFHKFPMWYLPMRYVVSMFFSMGILIAVVGSQLLMYDKTLIRVLTFLFLLFLTGINVVSYSHAYQNRSFIIRDLNDYFATQHLDSATVIGPWAPELTWETKALSMPIWRDYTQIKNPIETYRPRVVISEYDEGDSSQLYSGNNVSITSYADSVITTTIAFWKVNIYWINSAKLK